MTLVLRFLIFFFFATFLGYPLLKVGTRVDSAIAPEFWPVVASALQQAILSTLGALAVGVPLGYIYAKRWNRWLAAFSAVAFSLPSIFVVAFVQSALAGRDSRTGLGAVVFAHVYLNAPWIALATAEGVRSVPAEWIRAARTLGATSAQSFRRLVLPTIGGRLGLAVAQVFALCLGSFAIVLILGGGPPVTSLETEIYAAVRGGGLALGNAGKYALVQVLLATLPLWIVLVRRGNRPVRDGLSRRCEAAPKFGSGGSWVAVAFAAAWVFAPAYFFLRDFSPDIALRLFGEADVHRAIGISTRIAVFASVFVLLAGALVASVARSSRLVRFLASAPIGLSPLVVSLGFFLAYGAYVDPFEGSELGMVVVQGMLFLPFALRFFLPLVDAESSGPRRDLREVARTLGATPARAWRKFEWPRWRNAGGRLAGIVFVWSFSEVAASSFFGSERLVTLGRLLMTWFGQYRFAEANIVLFGMYLVTVVVLVLSEGREESGNA